MASRAHSTGAARPHVPAASRNVTQAEVDRVTFFVANAALAAAFLVLFVLG
jgi:hypothetical protein